MANELIIAPEVQNDLSGAYGWYEEKRPGLGEEFLSCIEASIELIRRNPNLHSYVHENYRRLLVRRFPYAIFYEHAGHQITIYGIFHTAREPRVWHQRLP